MANPSMDRAIRALEEKIEYTFNDKELLITALTHSSFINEQDMVKTNKAEDYYFGHNERLEFLGDSVLEIIITYELFLRFPHEREGALTKRRTNLVKNKMLGEMADKIGLSAMLRLGKGEETQGGRKKESIAGDAFEALLAAMYLDAQMAKLPDPLQPARHLITKLYEKLWNSKLEAISKPKDNKTLLQELSHSLFKEAPKYALLSAEGIAPNQVFTVEVILPNGKKVKEKGSSKRNAEQKAAEKALTMLKK